MIELRDSAYEHAFGLLDEAKHSAKKTKLALCELEDAMYECYETSKEENEFDEYDEPEMEYRRAYRNYRHDGHYGVREDDDDMDMRYRRMSRRSGMRMRRDRMGRFA